MIAFIKKLWNQWRCKHSWGWRHNYYGDQIIYNGWNRSAWKCEHCGKWEDRPELHKDHGRA